jgi:ABC-2 type transport system permease protein
MRNFWLIWKEDLWNLFKNPMWVFYGTLFPILLVVILGFLGKDSYGRVITSYDFYGITLMIYAVLLSGMTSANAFMEERIRKANMRIIYAPGQERVIYLAKIVSSFLFCALCHLFDMILLFSIFHVHITALPQLLMLFILTEIFANSLGVMFCCIFKTEAMANQILSIFINLFAIFGGLMFPMDGYGKAVRMISYLSPAKWIAKATFGMIYDYDYLWFTPVVIGMAVSIGIVLFVCDKTFRKEDCIC